MPMFGILINVFEMNIVWVERTVAMFIGDTLWTNGGGVRGCEDRTVLPRIKGRSWATAVGGRRSFNRMRAIRLYCWDALI